MAIIAITGDLGSGKSTVAKRICEITGMEYLSTGSIQRRIAKERGIDTLQLNKECRGDKSVDDLIDNRLRAMNTDGTDNIVLDSRLAWFFVKKSFKVYLKVEPKIAAQRVFKDDTRTSEPTGDTMQVLNNLLERKKEENERFKQFYNADCLNLDNYDLVLDTSDLSVDEVAGRIISAAR